MIGGPSDETTVADAKFPTRLPASNLAIWPWDICFRFRCHSSSASEDRRSHVARSRCYEPKYVKRDMADLDYPALDARVHNTYLPYFVCGTGMVLDAARMPPGCKVGGTVMHLHPCGNDGHPYID